MRPVAAVIQGWSREDNDKGTVMDRKRKEWIQRRFERRIYWTLRQLNARDSEERSISDDSEGSVFDDWENGGRKFSRVGV